MMVTFKLRSHSDTCTVRENLERDRDIERCNVPSGSGTVVQCDDEWLHSQGMVVPYRWESDTNSLFFRLRRPTPCAPISTSVFLLKGGTLATSS